MTLKLKRVATSSYETPDGYFSIYRDPTRMAGFFGGSWNILKGTREIHSEPTLREARAWLAQYIARGAK